VNTDYVLEQIQTHYRISRRFVHLYLQYIMRTKIDESEVEAFLAQVLSDPVKSMWFTFAITTNLRGLRLSNMLHPFYPAGARRHLDIGCAYGGFLVGFAEQGLEVTGIEIDPLLVELGRTNLDDNHVLGSIIEGDALDPKLISRLGQFNIITCNDVIEHVDDAESAITHMVRLLAPDGIVLMEVPNKDYIGFVASDGHYNLFGITLLRRKDAIAYYHENFKIPYTVGEYYDLKTYERKFSDSGCEVRLLPAHYAPEYVDMYSADIDSAIARQQKRVLSRISRRLYVLSKPGFQIGRLAYLIVRVVLEFLRFWFSRNVKSSTSTKVLVSRSFFAYLTRLVWALTLSIFSTQKRRDFEAQYLMPAWLILARKT